MIASFVAVLAPSAHAVALRAEVTWDQPFPAFVEIQIQDKQTLAWAVTGWYPPYYFATNPSFVVDGIPHSTLTEEGTTQSTTFTLDPVNGDTYAFTAAFDCYCFNRLLVPPPVTTLTIRFYEDGVFVRQIQHTFTNWSNDWELLASYPQDPGTFTFEYDNNAPAGKILLHDYTGTGAYSNYQLMTGPPTVRIPGTVTRSGQAVDLPVYFRVTDPPDKAPYATATAKADDNADTVHQKGVLYYIADDGTRVDADASGILKLPGNQQGVRGRVDARLEVSDHCSGDNYVVEASMDSTFSCHATNTCPTSALWTAWKRAYVEVDQMWQSGDLVAAVSPANTDLVYINDRRSFHRGDQVMLSHAPDFARVGPLGFYEEGPFTIVDIDRNHNTAVKATWTLVLNRAHQYEYRPDIAVLGVQLGDAVANVTGSGLFDASDLYLNALFKDAFVEYVTLPSSGVHVPFYEQLTPQQAIFVAEKWFHARAGNTVPPNSGIVVAAATRDPVGISRGAVSLGTTAGSAVSMVWRATIDTATSGPASTYPDLAGHAADLIAAEVLVHEVGHQWSVNPTYPAGECSQMAYDNQTKFCQMNSPPNASQYDDGHVAFHYNVGPNGVVDSEYATIRTQSEPKP